MDFTFGIITAGNNDDTIQRIIQSIRCQHIPHFEIIIVGHTSILGEHITTFPFDETVISGWITRKKNMVVEHAAYDNIVLMHDYVMLDNDWYRGFVQYGSNFDICVTKIKNKDGRRYRDYCFFPYHMEEPYVSNALIPYEYESSTLLSKLMYISGAYYIIKKHIALQYPLDERLCWGQGEDVELSKRLVSHGIVLQCNQYSTVHLDKQKYQTDWENELSMDNIQQLALLDISTIEQIHQLQYTYLDKAIVDMTGISILHSIKK